MDTNKLLNHLWRGGQFAYYWTAPKKLSYWFPVGQISPPPAGRQNTYFGVNPVTAIPSTNARGQQRDRQYIRSQNDYIAAINCLFAEFDVKDYGNADAIFLHVEHFPPPSVTVFSGGGYHFYWLLDEPFMIDSEDDRERARQAQANWVEYTGSDKQSKDLARVLRLPGTRNYKPAYAPEFPHVYIVETTGELYSLNDLEQLSRPEPTPEPVPLPVVSRPATNGDRQWYALHAFRVASDMVRQAADGEKHCTLLKAARLLGGYIAGGIVREQEAIRLLEDEISRKQNVDSLNGAYDTIRDGIEYGKAIPITLEQKLAERAVWTGQPPQTQHQPRQDRRFWSRQFEGYWERVR